MKYNKKMNEMIIGIGGKHIETNATNKLHFP